jgi:ribonuclease BN (tRNA processing enzyme)
MITRRSFLAGVVAVLPAKAGSHLVSGQVASGQVASGQVASGFSRKGTRLVLLGTAGGPTPKSGRSAPAQAIVVGDRLYLVDCGDGVARQLAIARIPIGQLRAVFITHQHSDHNAGYGPLFLLGWTAGLSKPVDVYGPPPLERMTTLLLDAYDYDIRLRMKDEGRPPLAPLVRPHEIVGGGEVFADDRVRVTAAVNHHPPIEHSFAYRIDTADRSIVISGDTNYSENVLKLARGADILVHEALYRPFWERPDAPQTPEIRRHIIASHTDAQDIGRLAAAAGVKRLVLTHFVPSEPTGAVPDETWLAAARKHFNGDVVLGRDLLEL